jgi:signal transduction histidine kinase
MPVFVSDSNTGAPEERREAMSRRGLVESVIESTVAGLAVLRGPDFVFEVVNPAYQAISPFREMEGRPYDAVWPETAEKILPIFHRVLETGAPFEAMDMRVDIRRAPGGPLEESYFSFVCRRLPGPDGGAPAILVNVLDTTPLVLARRRAEHRARRKGAALAAEHAARAQAERARDRFERLARLTSELNDGTDLDGVVDKAVCLSVSLFAGLLGACDGDLHLVEEGGASIRTVAGVPCSRRIGEATQLDLLPHFREAAETGHAVYLPLTEADAAEAEPLCGDGRTSSLILPLTADRTCFGFMDVCWKGSVDRPPAQDVAFAQVVADQCALAITRAWILESERTARAAAEQQRRRQELLGTMLAHELRSPIHAVAVTSTALLRGDGLDERQRDAMGRIASVARRMGGLVDELLDFARVRQADGIPVEPEPAEIEPICARAIQQQLDSHPGSEVVFSLRGAGGGQWDPSRLEQVVSNLVGNALERSPAGSAVEVTTTGTPDELVLTVRNVGPVIPSDLLASLFEPFRRGDRRGSIGLGLFITREIVQAHGGTIGVTSSHADGTRFTVRLPRSTPA